jgi:hypothetical protein
MPGMVDCKHEQNLAIKVIKIAAKQVISVDKHLDGFHKIFEQVEENAVIFNRSN